MLLLSVPVLLFLSSTTMACPPTIMSTATTWLEARCLLSNQPFRPRRRQMA